ncbi:MAG: hypothetical protein ACD_2C00238G0002 [uncultured bacterium (gcode 4)]|uniref:Uncharacterized protein n=1 Tax=uncultured bacterium (gcode 4) TaxID=1234023 RepID=K2G1J0_9BACT|nr:MAG: hypothetical protein ACD_2C00238G0002 [uncultured bacterium (gcode 4)]
MGKYINKQKTYAFTLVELIVVIVILAILATIAFLSFSSQSGSARDSTRLADISSIRKSIEMYNVYSGDYPKPDHPFSCTYSGWIIWNQWSIWDSAYKILQKNLSKKVTDPLKWSEYDYSLASNKREYQVAWNFENPTSLERNYNPFDSSILSPKLSALWWTWTNVYISWNYNWVLLKVFTGSTYYFVPTPTLFWINPTDNPILAYDNSFSSGTIILPWTNEFAIFDTNQIYSKSWTDFSDSDISNLVQAVKNSYSWSNISSPAVQQFLAANWDDLIDLWRVFINAIWWTVNGFTPLATFSLMQNSLQIWNTTNITDNCEVHPTSYSSSDTAVATIVWNTITALSAWTTYITQIWWNCADSGAKTLTVPAPPPQWKDNSLTICNKPDITVWNQTWAGCNSVLWTKAKNYNSWLCYNYNWLTWWTNCYWVATQENWSWISSSAYGYTGTWISNNIYWALYSWDDMSADNCFWTWITSSSCPCSWWYHVPTEQEWETLETNLWCDESQKFKWTPNWYQCQLSFTDFTNWIWWKSSNPNSLKNKLWLTLAGDCYLGTCHTRGNEGRYWSSSVNPLNTTTAYWRAMSYVAWSDLLEVAMKSVYYSVRCIKD